MSKQVNLTTAEVYEIVLQPSNNIISVFYQIKDNLGNVVFSNNTSLKITDLPNAGQTAVNNLASKLLDKVITKEGI